jgi:hypothetical protein
MASSFEEDIGKYSSESIELDDNVIKESQCSNPESYITGDSYTSLDKHFYTYNGKGFSDAHCINLNDEIIGAIKSDYDTHDPAGFSSFFSIGGGNPLEAYGCIETNKYIFKLNLSAPYFITIGSLDRIFRETNVSKWYLVKMFNSKRRRIINLTGSYASSRHHCQVPGFYIYKAFTKQELLDGVSLDEDSKDWLDEGDDNIFDIISKYIPKDSRDNEIEYTKRVVDELKRGVYISISKDRWGPKNSTNAIAVLSWLGDEHAGFARRYLDIIEAKGITPELYDPEFETLIKDIPLDYLDLKPKLAIVFKDWINN